MRRTNALLLLICKFAMLIAAVACGGSRSASPSNASNKPAASPQATQLPKPKNGDYPGKGTVTKINADLGSVEMDHDDIPGIMPPMRMEFFVSDKKLLDGLKVGDAVDFTLRYTDGQEIIVAIARIR
ncbi:MAG TPA: copper-binding protein [Pyrinomonadaceae bacterium]|nr:copper-binding protein [Pyrinomonadaceae bacterium]